MEIPVCVNDSLADGADCFIACENILKLVKALYPINVAYDTGHGPGLECKMWSPDSLSTACGHVLENVAFIAARMDDTLGDTIDGIVDNVIDFSFGYLDMMSFLPEASAQEKFDCITSYSARVDMLVDDFVRLRTCMFNALHLYN
ncbi:MAG: hypothetical protein V1725_00220 [archaeon]